MGDDYIPPRIVVTNHEWLLNNNHAAFSITILLNKF